MNNRQIPRSVVIATLAVAAWNPTLAAPNAVDDVFSQAGFDQRLGQRVPGDPTFIDERRRPVRFGDLLGEKPLVIVPGYFECPNLCGVAFRGVAEALEQTGLGPSAYTVVAVSIDSGEGPAEAQAVEKGLFGSAGDAAANGWHLLTGTEEAIHAVTDAIGFRYAYDPDLDQYAHAAGIVLTAPDGTITSYSIGLEHKPRDLRLGIVEASSGQIGSVVDHVLLLCYDYDPKTGQYSLAVTRTLQWLGVAFVASLAVLLFVLSRRRRRADHGGAA